MSDQDEVDRTAAWLTLAGKDDVLRLYRALVRYEAACHGELARKVYFPGRTLLRQGDQGIYELCSPSDVRATGDVTISLDVSSGKWQRYNALGGALALAERTYVGKMDEVIEDCAKHLEEL